MTAPTVSADAWAVWLNIRRTGRVNSNVAQLARDCAIAPLGGGITKKHRERASGALTELEDSGYIRRTGSTYAITRTEMP